jgi:hypothetical protein
VFEIACSRADGGEAVEADASIDSEVYLSKADTATLCLIECFTFAKELYTDELIPRRRGRSLLLLSTL